MVTSHRGAVRARGGARSEPQDDHGRVVGGQAEPHQFVRQILHGQGAVLGKPVGEAAQTYVDVLPAAFDQAVGVQNERGPRAVAKRPTANARRKTVLAGSDICCRDVRNRRGARCVFL